MVYTFEVTTYPQYGAVFFLGSQKSLNWPRNSPSFMGTDGSLPLTREAANGP